MLNNFNQYKTTSSDVQWQYYDYSMKEILQWLYFFDVHHDSLGLLKDLLPMRKAHSYFLDMGFQLSISVYPVDL